jgi:hypothetical protein
MPSRAKPDRAVIKRILPRNTLTCPFIEPVGEPVRAVGNRDVTSGHNCSFVV